MRRNLLVILAITAAAGSAETIKYFKLGERTEITEEEASRTKHR